MAAQNKAMSIVVSPPKKRTRNLTESTATRELSRFFYHGVGKYYLGYRVADEELQPDGTWKKLGSDRYAFWKTPDDEVHRRRFNPVADHIKGHPRHRGIVSEAKGSSSTHVPFISGDIDRHSASIPEKDHIVLVLKVGRLLRKHFSDFRWLVEVNPKNGSSKFFGFNGRPIPLTQAKRVAEDIHTFLKKHGCGELEVFPHKTDESIEPKRNFTQVGLPMRADKVMIVGSGVLPKCQRKRKNAEGRMESYEAYSALALHDSIRTGQQYDEMTLLKALKEGCAALPYRPASEQVMTPRKVHVTEPECKRPMPPATGHYRDDPNAFNRQLAAMLELCRRLRRVAGVAEGLAYLQQNSLFSGEWEENECERVSRVRWILAHIAKTFDSAKCSGVRYTVNVGKYDQWARRNVGTIKGRDRHDLDEYGNLVIRRNGTTVNWRYISAFLSVVEFCLIVEPNDDGSLPQDRAEKIWNQCFPNTPYCDRKWKVCREYLHDRGIIRITDRCWVFGHGNGKAMRWKVTDDFNRLPQWYKRVHKPSMLDAVPLDVFLGSMTDRVTPTHLNLIRTSDVEKRSFDTTERPSGAPP